MKRLLAGVSVFVFLMGLFAIAFAAGSADEAKDTVDKAIAFMKANGKEKAFAEFNNKTGKFVKGDLYVFVIDLNGKCLAHGGNEKLVGKDVTGLKDSDGKFFIKDVIEGAKAKGTGGPTIAGPTPPQKPSPKRVPISRRKGI